MIDNILVPTDGGDGAEHAAELAIDIASEYGASLQTVYVVDARTALAEQWEKELWSNLEKTLAHQGKEAVDAIADLATDESVPVTTNVVGGVPYQEIIDYTQNHDIDLIVMGTHGRTGVKRVLIGSVAEKVVRHSDIPVLTVPLPKQQRTDENEVNNE